MPYAEKLYFMFCIDCEPLKEKSPACGGPSTWDVSEKAVARYAEIFRARGMIRALSYHTTPEAGRAHRDLFLSLREEGCDIAMQLNVPGFRYPKYERDLGFYDRDDQRQILQEATADFTDTFGFRPETYTACCGSRNKHTHPLLADLGYRQCRSAGSGRYFPDRGDRCTVGQFPFPFWASADHQLLSGDLPLYVIPGSVELTCTRGQRPFDLRPESPPTPETHERYRSVIDQRLEVQKLLDLPVKVIVAAGHNTERVSFENVEFVLDYVREAVAREGFELIEANCPVVREVAAAVRGLS